MKEGKRERRKGEKGKKGKKEGGNIQKLLELNFKH